MSEHTPGPWTYGTEDDARSWGFIRAGEKYRGAIHSPAVARVCKRSFNLGYNEAEANARLIAAAPDLLAVAEALLLFYSVDWTQAKRERWLALTGHDEATTKALADFARAAIAKATEPAP